MWHAVIMVVLLSPTPPSEMERGITVPPEAFQALKDICLCLDLWHRLDEGWNPSFQYEMTWAWQTRRDLDGLPPSSDRHRFPSPAYAWEMQQFNIDVQTRLTFRSWHRYAEEGGAQLRQAWTVWGAVRRAGMYNNPRITREALQELKSLIGENEYHLGRLPPHVPLWLFSE